MVIVPELRFSITSADVAVLMVQQPQGKLSWTMLLQLSLSLAYSVTELQTHLPKTGGERAPSVLLLLLLG